MNRLRNAGAFIAMAIAIIMVASPVQAHTAEEQAEWFTLWEDRALTAGYTPALLLELSDFVDRHAPKVSTGSGVTPHRPGPVEYSAGVEQWRTLVAAYFPADQVEKALRVMGCESGGNPNAHNPSGASGLFQLMPIWWAGKFDPYNPEANVAAAAALWASSGWAPWVCQ